MMQYSDKYFRMMMPFIKKSLKRRYGKEYTKDLVKKTDVVYRDMLSRIDDIGADNPMASNIYSCLVFLALWKAADGRISISDLRKITLEMMSIPALKLAGLMVNGNKESGIKRFRAMMEKDAAWLEEHPQYKAVSWDFNFDENKHQDGFYYHFTQCPLNTFARREGYEEVLPVMCDIDHLTARLMHFKLHREQTLAGGGSVCDYWFVGDKVKNPR